MITGKVYGITEPVYRSNGMYATLGTARNAYANSTWGTIPRRAGGIYVSDLNWKLVDAVEADKRFPWRNPDYMRSDRLRARAAKLLEEADRLDGII